MPFSEVKGYQETDIVLSNRIRSEIDCVFAALDVNDGGEVVGAGGVEGEGERGRKKRNLKKKKVIFK